MGAASVCCSLVTLSTANVLNGDVNPRVLSILFVPALAAWIFFSKCACDYRHDKTKPISAEIFLSALAGSFLMQIGIPIWIVGSPYFIRKYLSERNYL